MNLLNATPLLLYLTFGLIYCFFGYRFVKAMLVAFGCFCGLAVGLLAGHALLEGSAGGMMLLGAFGALAGGLLFALVFKFALFAAGFGAGSILAPLLVHVLTLDLSSPAGLVVVALCGVIVGLMTLMLERQVMIIISAALGAVVTVVSIHLLIRSSLQLDPEQMREAYSRAFHATWWLVLTLFGLGTVFQWRTTGKKE